MGVLPTLIGEPLIGLTMIFNKPVAIGAARSIDPRQSSFYLRPQFQDRIAVARALVIEPREHDKKRRRIYASII